MSLQNKIYDLVPKMRVEVFKVRAYLAKYCGVSTDQMRRYERRETPVNKAMAVMLHKAITAKGVRCSVKDLETKSKLKKAVKKNSK